MNELERFFKCPYCREKISILLDLSVEGQQVYIEDCEVCCRPIQVVTEAVNGEMQSFTAQQS